MNEFLGTIFAIFIVISALIIFSSLVILVLIFWGINIDFIWFIRLFGTGVISFIVFFVLLAIKNEINN